VEVCPKDVPADVLKKVQDVLKSRTGQAQPAPAGQPGAKPAAGSKPPAK
jgi:hypothetical protein